MNDMTQADPASPVLAPGAPWRVVNLSAGTSRNELSAQWFRRPQDQRFLTLAELAAKKRKFFEESRQVTVKTSEIRAFGPEITGRESFNVLQWEMPKGDVVEATNWAFQQAAGLAKAPAAYLKTLPSPIVAENLNWGLRYNREIEEVKAYYRMSDEDGNSLNALTGVDYGRVPDFEVAEALERAIEGHPWKVPGVMDWSSMVYNPLAPVTKETTTIFGSDRDLFVFLVDDLHPVVIGKWRNPATGVEEDDIVFRGFYITNSEVGKSALKIAVFYLRALCCNRIMWGVEGFEEINIRHSKGAPDRWLREATPALDAFASKSTDRLIEGVKRAKAAILVEDEKEAVAYLKAASLSLSRIDRVMQLVETEEGHPARSAWDFAQGLTALARDEINQDNRLDLELTAKRILDKVA